MMRPVPAVSSWRLRCVDHLTGGVQHIDDGALLGAGVVAFETHAYSARSGATSSMKAAFSAAGLNSTIKQPVSVKTRSWPAGM